MDVPYMSAKSNEAEVRLLKYEAEFYKTCNVVRQNGVELHQLKSYLLNELLDLERSKRNKFRQLAQNTIEELQATKDNLSKELDLLRTQMKKFQLTSNSNVNPPNPSAPARGQVDEVDLSMHHKEEDHPPTPHSESFNFNTQTATSLDSSSTGSNAEPIVHVHVGEGTGGKDENNRMVEGEKKQYRGEPKETSTKLDPDSRSGHVTNDESETTKLPSREESDSTTSDTNIRSTSDHSYASRQARRPTMTTKQAHSKVPSLSPEPNTSRSDPFAPKSRSNDGHREDPRTLTSKKLPSEGISVRKTTAEKNVRRKRDRPRKIKVAETTVETGVEKRKRGRPKKVKTNISEPPVVLDLEKLPEENPTPTPHVESSTGNVASQDSSSTGSNTEPIVHVGKGTGGKDEDNKIVEGEKKRNRGQPRETSTKLDPDSRSNHVTNDERATAKLPSREELDSTTNTLTTEKFLSEKGTSVKKTSETATEKKGSKVRRKVGRPRKTKVVTTTTEAGVMKRKRGRPKKVKTNSLEPPVEKNGVVLERCSTQLEPDANPANGQPPNSHSSVEDSNPYQTKSNVTRKRGLAKKHQSEGMLAIEQSTKEDLHSADGHVQPSEDGLLRYLYDPVVAISSRTRSHSHSQSSFPDSTEEDEPPMKKVRKEMKQKASHEEKRRLTHVVEALPDQTETDKAHSKPETVQDIELKEQIAHRNPSPEIPLQNMSIESVSSPKQNSIDCSHVANPSNSTGQPVAASPERSEPETREQSNTLPLNAPIHNPFNSDTSRDKEPSDSNGIVGTGSAELASNKVNIELEHTAINGHTAVSKTGGEVDETNTDSDKLDSLPVGKTVSNGYAQEDVAKVSSISERDKQIEPEISKKEDKPTNSVTSKPAQSTNFRPPKATKKLPKPVTATNSKPLPNSHSSMSSMADESALPSLKKRKTLGGSKSSNTSVFQLSIVDEDLSRKAAIRVNTSGLKTLKLLRQKDS